MTVPVDRGSVCTLERREHRQIKWLKDMRRVGNEVVRYNPINEAFPHKFGGTVAAVAIKQEESVFAGRHIFRTLRDENFA